MAPIAPRSRARTQGGARLPFTSMRAASHLSAASRRWYEAITGAFALDAHHLRLLRLAAEAWDEKSQAIGGLGTPRPLLHRWVRSSERGSAPMCTDTDGSAS
jgi:hypothetical protein